jgi:pimeloyl-ACP methyl ester carboxylesterase
MLSVRLILLSVVTIFAFSIADSDASTGSSIGSVPSFWEGTRRAEGRVQAVVLHVARSNGVENGTVDLPDFGAIDIPASRLTFRPDGVHFELVGDSSTAVFDGRIHGDSLSGSWNEGKRSGTFSLHRLLGPRVVAREERIVFHDGSVRLVGSLMIQKRRAPVPAIVFVQGAGPETRSASKFLAEFFSRHGIAAFVYDKRGAGESGGDWKRASFDDLAGDVVAAVTYLRGRKEIDPTRIGLFGSSQGGWIAPMAAVRLPGLRFVIVKSTAAFTPEVQELARVRRQMQSSGKTRAEVAQALALYRHAIAYARTGHGFDALIVESRIESKENVSILPDGVAKNWWFFDLIRSSFAHDPLPVLERVTSPMLFVFGSEDADGPPIDRSVARLMPIMTRSGTDVEIFSGAGHDLRVEPVGGRAWDFPRFPSGYLDSLWSWVHAHVES